MKNTLCIVLILILSQPAFSPPVHETLILEYENKVKYQIQDEIFSTSEFSIEVFYKALVFTEIQNPDIVFKQSILETGWFTSRSFTEYHNPFGMKQPRIRETYAIGTKLNHGEFTHWYEAVKDYKLWQDYWIKQKLDTEEYYVFLDQLPYAEGPRYTKVLRSIQIGHLIEQTDS